MPTTLPRSTATHRRESEAEGKVTTLKDVRKENRLSKKNVFCFFYSSKPSCSRLQATLLHLIIYFYRMQRLYFKAQLFKVITDETDEINISVLLQLQESGDENSFSFFTGDKH